MEPASSLGASINPLWEEIILPTPKKSYIGRVAVSIAHLPAKFAWPLVNIHN